VPHILFYEIASYSVLGNNKFLKICELPLWRKVNIVKPENGTGESKPGISMLR
jgi:hypothetical protein